MPLKLPKPLWNLLAVFFAAWCVVSAWLLLGSESSPVVRLAFTVCGAAMLFTGSVGGLFRAVGRGLLQGMDWLMGKKIGYCVGVFVVAGMFVAILFPIFLHAQNMARYTSASSELKSEWFALNKYVNAHSGILPPDMRDEQRRISLADYWRFEKPLTHRSVWCKDLAGLRIADIAHPERVIIAYSRESFGRYERPVLYLDGHLKPVRSMQALNDQLRERPALLAHAIRAKAKRDTDAKSPTKKATP